MNVYIILLIALTTALGLSWILLFELRYYALRYKREHDRMQRQTILLLNKINGVLGVYEDAMNIVDHHAVNDAATAKQAFELRLRLQELEGPLDVN